jgi:hypothetical protein
MIQAIKIAIMKTSSLVGSVGIFMLVLLSNFAVIVNAAQPKRTEKTVAGRQTYTPGKRAFAPDPVPVGTRQMVFTFDKSQITTKAITWDLVVEISRTGCKPGTWDLLWKGGEALGGNASSSEAVLYAWFSQPTDANVCIRGHFEIAGGNLQTEIRGIFE